jgi:hypothetical protein
VSAVLRDRPQTCIAAYLEWLPAIPMTPSGKADRTPLPAPAGRAFRGMAEHNAPAIESERALAETLGGDRVSACSHLFHDLGANSLPLAWFCALLRADTGLPPVLVDAYLHPMITGLVAVLDGRTSLPSAAPTRRPGPNPRSRHWCYPDQRSGRTGMGAIATAPWRSEAFHRSMTLLLTQGPR